MDSWIPIVSVADGAALGFLVKVGSMRDGRKERRGREEADGEAIIYTRHPPDRSPL